MINNTLLITEWTKLYNKSLPLIKKDLIKQGREYSSIVFVRVDVENERIMTNACIDNNNGFCRTALNLDFNYITELLHNEFLKQQEKKTMEELGKYSNGQQKKPRNIDLSHDKYKRNRK